MQYDIRIGEYSLGMLDKVEIVKSVELLADTATITLPASQYNIALEVEDKLHRGDRVSIRLGYEEEGMVEEFAGYLQRIGTDGGSIKLYCEDELFLMRKSVPNCVMTNIGIVKLLEKIIAECKLDLKVACSYEWTYSKLVIKDATGYDVLKKVQEECGADIYIQDGMLHVHPPGEKVGTERHYDFALNVESEDLIYRRAEDKKVKVVVKAIMPDGTVKEIEVGNSGGDKVEVKAATSDEVSMRARGNAELKRRTFDGYEGSITTWLVPVCNPADSATLRDADYAYKDGTYFVTSVTTSFSKDGGQRKINLGFRLS